METVLRIEQPAWLVPFIAATAAPGDDDARIADVLALAGENVRRETGGPFAAAVYDESTGERLACAVNVVVPGCCSLAHAETLAIALAQRDIGAWHLADRPRVLVSSAEPCAMCLGAICWSGVSRLVFAAARADVEAVGFDEGPRPARWRAALAERGIDVVGPLRRTEARAVLASYQKLGGLVYAPASQV